MRKPLMNGLTLRPRFFYGGDKIDRNAIMLAGWHNPRSITWRWVLSYHRRNSPWWRPRLPLRLWRHNAGGSIYLRLPLIGSLCFAWQQSMWRDAKKAADGRA